MANLSTEICFLFKEARRAKGLNQSALARMLGCRQSAISMFEGGQSTKLSDETVKKMAELLGVEIPDDKKEEDEADSVGVASGPARMGAEETGEVWVRGYCPNGHCPSNIPYVVEGRLFYRPNRILAAPTGGARCTQCGEILETRCPVCGAPLNDGACCAVCGGAYVTPVLPDGVDPAAYARARRDELLQLKALA